MKTHGCNERPIKTLMTTALGAHSVTTELPRCSHIMLPRYMSADLKKKKITHAPHVPTRIRQYHETPESLFVDRAGKMHP